MFFHPLLRDLLIRRFTEVSEETRRSTPRKCRRLLDHRLWDEALAVSEHSLDAEFIADALAVALDDSAGRGPDEQPRPLGHSGAEWRKSKAV